ncbi:PAQR family membrane homeostasis protein TrhA [Shewanella sp.]|uniref:PAQR family membrane homeostasis protein TrhA n=1 Tax=Shewanella sp. TaxID=50422 RepID=UPI004048759F
MNSLTDTLSTNQSATSVSISDYCHKEERANAISHGFGVVAGVVGLVLMLLKAPAELTFAQISGVVVYGLSIIVLFLASTLYHSSQSVVWRKRFKMADHCAIYTLIAGTYTPLMLISIQSTQATIVLIAIWSLALGGIIFKTLFIGRFKVFSVLLYLIMGWLCVTVMGDLKSQMSELGLSLLLAGGLFYSLGVIFYVGKRIPFNHAIWHLFVLGGAFSHFFCIYLTVL